MTPKVEEQKKKTKKIQFVTCKTKKEKWNDFRDLLYVATTTTIGVRVEDIEAIMKIASKDTQNYIDTYTHTDTFMLILSCYQYVEGY